MNVEFQGVWIGEYAIRPSERAGMIWMEHESGEGMEIEEAKLAEALKAFYSENF
jgi:hypothetical protein